MAGWTPVCVLVYVAVATPVLAQTTTAREAPVRRSLVEVGGGVNGAIFLGEGVTAFPNVQARVNLLPSASAEVATHFLPGAFGGFYDVRGRFGRTKTAPVSPYFTVGGLGLFEIQSRRQFQNRLPTGDVVVHPAYTSHRLSAPMALTVGGGTSVLMGRRLSFEVGGEAWVSDDGVALSMRTTIVVGVGPKR
jgi:hypothetical protein